MSMSACWRMHDNYHVVHAYGFGLVTWVCRHGLWAALATRGLRCGKEID